MLDTLFAVYGMYVLCVFCLELSTFLTELRQQISKQPSRDGPANQEEFDIIGTPDATSGYQELEMSRR